MEIDVKIPSVGESIKEAVLAEWYKADGDFVEKEEMLLVIETDKVTLEVPSEGAGTLKILVPEGETVAVGAVVGKIDTKGAAQKSEIGSKTISEAGSESRPEIKPEIPSDAKPAVASPKPPVEETKSDDVQDTTLLAPSARRLIQRENLDVSKIKGTGPGGRITKSDVLLYREARGVSLSPVPEAQTTEKISNRVIKKPMSPIRRRIASRLLEAKQNTAMLTTFNEIDMSRAMGIRTQYKEAFKKKHDVNLGFMSFFIKATVEALKEFPAINAFIEDTDIVYHEYYHIGVAVGSPKGLVVPVIRDADQLSFAGVEKSILDYVVKIKENKLQLADLEGGTFTITNGGVFGSLLSTPILNIPQSGILGMHKIEDRPVVVDGEIVIRPMMYVALSYDHRIVDGREGVTFLRRIKECMENPERIMMEI